MAGGRVLFFSAPCGFSKTALAEALLRGQVIKAAMPPFANEKQLRSKTF